MDGHLHPRRNERRHGLGARAGRGGAQRADLAVRHQRHFEHLWSPLFFKLRRPDWALYEVFFFWASVLALVVYIAGIYPPAAWIIAPYLVWVTFAGFLNWRVVQLNRPFGTRS